jgi:hypothetical protein
VCRRFITVRSKDAIIQYAKVQTVLLDIIKKKIAKTMPVKTNIVRSSIGEEKGVKVNVIFLIDAVLLFVFLVLIVLMNTEYIREIRLWKKTELRRTVKEVMACFGFIYDRKALNAMIPYIFYR